VFPSLVVGLSTGPAAAYLATTDAVRARLGSGAFDAVTAEAALAPWDSAVATALQYAKALAGPEQPRNVTGDDPRADERTPGRDERSLGRAERLTPRELDLLRLLARGDTNRGVAGALGLRPKTVMHHSVSIYGKIGVRGRAEATAWAYRHDLIDDPTGS